MTTVTIPKRSLFALTVDLPDFYGHKSIDYSLFSHSNWYFNIWSMYEKPNAYLVYWKLYVSEVFHIWDSLVCG